ncbi:transcriptional regulator [Halohasta litorea]|uniref:Transcriptional regulator n=1 Tax=Halohasta litorea TaxID=869891 RepID=A0ABD6D3N5_9EURY|nr:helix-turn-helix domain-containing protein [Halohasta litorea]MEA1930780.1 transcriptional regulator [Euryarchaeota archaeon]
MTDSTRRERLAETLGAEPATASQLADTLDTPVSTVYQDLKHVARSVRSAEDREFLVAPPECSSCGFSNYDDPVNYPSRCPECRSESIQEAVFKIE